MLSIAIPLTPKSGSDSSNCFGLKFPAIWWFLSKPQFPSAIGWRKKSTSYNHETTIWVSHEYYLNPEFHKILWRAFWVIAILRFSPYVARVDFKGLISK